MARDEEMQNCTICVSRQGAIRILTGNSGWSFPGLAAEYGASALFAVDKRGATITVEGWSPQETCLLRRDLSAQRWFRAPSNQFYATLNAPAEDRVSTKDLSPHERNS